MSEKVINLPKEPQYRRLIDYLGREDYFPVVKCFLNCPLFSGWVDAVRAPIKYCAVLLGNIEGVAPLSSMPFTTDSVKVQAVTRSAAKKDMAHPLVVSELTNINISFNEFRKLQRECPTLLACWDQFTADTDIEVRSGLTIRYVTVNDLLYREVISGPKNLIGSKILVIPEICRPLLLKISHDIPVAGHFSHRKTYQKIKEKFWWPGMTNDSFRFCRSCDKCQKTSAKGRTKNVPLEKVPIISTPFQRVAMDIVGPVNPISAEGYRYILTMVDYASSFPEAVALKNITSIDIAEALISIFARVGIPKEIISDRGPQFVLDLLSQVHRLIGVKPLFTTPYHPAANGRIERQHSILKAILKKLCMLKPRDWPRYLPAALFAMREMPSDSLQFSPFELLYGRQVRGLLAVLHALWVNPDLTDDLVSSYQFIFELRNKLAEVAELAHANLKVSSDCYKTYFDLKTSKRKLNINDEVLILLPDTKIKLQMTWSGPYKVTGKKGNVDYYVDVNGKSKLYHINLLKKYYRRANVNMLFVADQVDPVTDIPFSSNVCRVCVVEEDNDSPLEIVTLDKEKSKVTFNLDLSESCRQDLQKIVDDYSDVFSDVPGCTHLLQHEIRAKTAESFRKKLYPIPVHLKEEFDKEVKSLLDFNIIEPSDSPYPSPPIMIKKPDGSYRLAIDFRMLNSISHFDAEPMPTLESELYKFSNANFISEIDITKAYHQVPLALESRKYTAFPTNLGLMQYTRMPFGLASAPATYIRLMRKVLKDVDNVVCYFDNIFVISQDWESHLQHLRNVMTCLREHGLVAKPSKCFLGFQEITYLGYKVGHNTITPLGDRISALLQLNLPRSKKALRSFWGSVNFYRKFIPNMADKTSCLTSFLAKDVKEPFELTEEATEEFDNLKDILCNPPVLAIPDLNEIFCLRTDASSTGLGAVLFQYYDGVPLPTVYASKKLLDRETRYSAIECECLAVVWGIQHFQYYLYGRKFILETDHHPLQYLESFKGSNSRLMRWSLSLQPFTFQVVHIAGINNHVADILSRSN